MSTEPEPPSIEDYEQTILGDLDALEVRIQGRINNIPASAIPEQLRSAIQDLNAEMALLHQYEPCVIYLASAERPQASQKLADIVADVQKTIHSYVKMHRDHAVSLRATQQIKFQTILDSTKRQQEAFDIASKQKQADFDRCCVHCNYPLGDVYLKLTICPNCKQPLRPPPLAKR